MKCKICYRLTFINTLLLSMANPSAKRRQSMATCDCTGFTKVQGTMFT